MAFNLKQRLLQDIAELQTKPYPNITLHLQDEDITEACLILEPEGYGSMHLTVIFPDDYPLRAPMIRMDSEVDHPNIFGSYICASILNTEEGYTPAYTLKGVAIQLLSFFSSDKVEQEGGHYTVNLEDYRVLQSYIYGQTHKCTKCQYGMPTVNNGLGQSLTRSTSPTESVPSMSGEGSESNWPSPQQATQSVGRNARLRKSKENALVQAQASMALTPSATKLTRNIVDMKMPNEIILLICEKLETEDLMSFAEAWEKVGRVITQYDVIRTRELQCFCFKKDYMCAKLGIGINVVQRGKIGTIESEFDLLSYEGFHTHKIRRSVQGREFYYWIPLPISHGHWRNVRPDINASLRKVANAASMGNVKPVQVIYHFMNDVVVKLNEQTSQATSRNPHYPYEEIPKSTLTHASEKAIESYFHLFHLLLCLATEDPSIVHDANTTLLAFTRGSTSKTSCPNLGHLLVAALISTIEISDAMLKSIIKETITRNVVWMLDSRGASMPELAYLEPSAISHYRLQQTFDASKTSYRLLMFLNLFRRTAVGSPRKPLPQLRDEAFERHGAPPRGSARGLADSIKRIHQVKCFPEFLQAMGIGKPSAEWFTGFLRECVRASAEKGYSRMPLSQGQALGLRLLKEPDVEVQEGLEAVRGLDCRTPSFFPAKGGVGAGGKGDTRGNWRGRGGRRG
ncbi:hypothetical protein EG329_006438 [Mollisiaceae sp. DMI_Dod_QoI]|nr:hypothetical protein EG329_006438 [Helotiales sp. DMI_Dod_QoI]